MTGCLSPNETCGVVIATKMDSMVSRLLPLASGRDTEIDMIEREMEGGVVIIQPPEVHEHDSESRLGGLIEIEEQVDVHEIKKTSSGEPKA